MTGWEWPNSTVTGVVDGGTFDARVTRDLGFGGTSTFVVRLRLNRVNAPAGNTAKGAAARRYLASLVMGWPAVNITTVKPYKYAGPASSPGSWMAEVTVPDGNVSDLMVEAGHAVSWDGAGKRPEDG